MHPFKQVVKIFNDVNTGVDGATYDAARVFMNSGCSVMLGGALASIWHRSFDPIAFGGGYAALLTGAGAAIWMKRDTEPRVSVTSTSHDGAGTITQVEAKS